jgi:LuxR family maltose regulon positive regulatory protein
MEIPLLQTKFYIPPPLPELVSRPSLIEQLHIGLHRKLTLISAPAGFGKTTLVSEWVRMAGAVREPILHIAWLSLDEDDNDPARFLAYCIGALNRINGMEDTLGKGALSMLQSPQPPPIETILTLLINEILPTPEEIVLVLDDYHLMDAQPIHDAVTFLLEHQPPQMHLVIATREDPPLPLARLRARGQLTELRATDLRFSPSETAEFLNQMMGLNLSSENIAALENRTEGWIAGLQLAAVSMQRSKDVSTFIQSFTGSHHFVLDYLIEEVLEQQPESVQTFLLQTAILDRLSGPLCNAVTGQHNGQATLEMLQHANLFIIPLDEELHWYRYHHLFADLLRQRLRLSRPDLIPVLHSKACTWYEQNGFVDDTIEHALRAQDYQRAALLIDNSADSFWQRGKHKNLRRWLECLPDEWILSKPQLSISRAYYLHSNGQYQAGEYLIQEVEKALGYNPDLTSKDLLKRKPSDESDWLRLHGKVAVIRALMHSFSGDVPGMMQHANRALEYLPENDLTWRSLAAFPLGDAYSWLGDMHASFLVRSEAARACEAAGDVYYCITANLKLASTLRELGNLQQTVQISWQYIQRAREYGLFRAGPVGCLLALYGEVLAELNDLDEALHQAKLGVEIAEGGGNLVIIGFSYLYLMRVLLSTGNLAAIEQIIQKVTQLEREVAVPAWLIDQMGVWQARIWLEQDKLDAASQWMDEHPLTINGVPIVNDSIDFLFLFDYIMFVRILIAQSQPDDAFELSIRLLEIAEHGERTTRVIELLILQALALQAKGDTDQALTAVEKALTLAAPGGFIRIFVDEGLPIARLLYETLNRGITPDYVRRVLAAFPIDEPKQAGSLKILESASELIEPLSDRELEVLQHIAEGLTNSEIASRLYISLNTVKAHSSNIYGKLDVHNRTRAVTRARALGILPPTDPH